MSVLQTFLRKLGRMSDRDLGEIRKRTEMITWEKYKLGLVKENTLQVEKGQDYVKTMEGIIKLLEGEKDRYVAQILVNLGYKQNKMYGIDLRNGKITEQ